MNTMIKGALIFGGLALVSVFAGRCHAEGMICPDSISFDKEFTISIYTKQRVDGMSFLSPDYTGLESYPVRFPLTPLWWDMSKYPPFTDSLKIVFKVPGRNESLNTPYVDAFPMYLKPDFSLARVPMGGGHCKIYIKKEISTYLIRQKAKPVSGFKKLHRSILGRTNAIIQ
jgi:hypothetical protein